MDKPRLDSLASPDTWLTCPVCGTRFQPEKLPACAQCPLHSGCTMACCPNCGTNVINPQASRLARWAERLLNRNQQTSQRENQP